MDRENMAHDLALAFAVSEISGKEFEEPQSKIEQLLEDYCAAYGFVSSRNDAYIKELIRRGE